MAGCGRMEGEERHGWGADGGCRGRRMNKQDMMKMQGCVLRVNIHCDVCKHKVKKLLQKIEVCIYQITMGEAESGKISLKLLVDRNANRVIFGEAGKDFVDFLFQFLSLPIGTVVKLLTKNKMVGSLGKIYESIENMQANYMEPNLNKDHVLNPKVYSSLGDTPLLLGNKGNADQLNDMKFLYRCGSGCSYIASDQQTLQDCIA